MVFAEYFDIKSDTSKIAEYNPSDNIYIVTEYRRGRKIEQFTESFDSSASYLEYINQLRNIGYTRRNIFNGKN